MRSDPDTTQLLRSWLREAQHPSADRLHHEVLALLDATPQRHRLRPAGRALEGINLAMLTAAAAVLVIAIVGTSLLRGSTGPGGPAVSPSQSSQPTSPTPAVTSSRRPSDIDVGFIGLPPEGASASLPKSGRLIDSYPVHGGGLPFEGMVRLYADGRLIWYMFLDGPSGRNSESTGYLEQRLTPEGVGLVQNHSSLDEKDPLVLPGWLPSSAWADEQIRAYVPSSYAICLEKFDPDAPIQERLYPQPGPPMDRLSMLALLPAPAADLLRGRETLPPLDDAPDCLAMTIPDARLLDRALSAGGLDQDESQNRYVLQYHRDAPGPGTSRIMITFEPRFPDGTFGCSACG